MKRGKETAAEREERFELDGVYLVALLQISVEQGVGSAENRRLIPRLQQEMGIDEDTLSRFVEEHKTELLHTIECLGF